MERLDSGFEKILSELSVLMTDEMLRKIAAADYGYGEEGNFKILKGIATSQQLPSMVDFGVTECLELTRWILPANREEHLVCAFSSALLLILQEVSDHETIGDQNAELATLIESLTVLEIATESAQELIIWRIVSDYKKELALYLADEEDRYCIDEITVNAFFIHALLLLLVYNKADEKDIGLVVDWSIDMEKDAKNLAPFYNPNRESSMTSADREATFLLGTTHFNQSHEIWKTVTKQMIDWKKWIISANIHKKLEAIIDCVIHEKPMKF
ncbi:hypothetical protein [Flavobacterium sp.]|uniref:hypothetical protein n=1 Tax=Flavobacterium sp. TaxID=239 RepID=UPI0039E4B047